MGPSIEEAAQGLFEFLNALYDAHDEKVRLLYKYRSCDPHHISCLKDDALWFSTADRLNDPFDCTRRLPASTTAEDVQALRVALSNVEPYVAHVSTASEIAEHIGNSVVLRPLEPLGSLAVQQGHHRLLRHIRRPDPNNERWLRKLMRMTREVMHEVFGNVTIFCLSELRDNQLMWAHYAASHSGFCTGYVCPVGIQNPALVSKVRYVERPPLITLPRAVQDPGDVLQDLVLTKPRDWEYEAEWRITFGNMAGRVPRLLPYREVIMGARISANSERQLREAAAGRDVQFFRAVPSQHGGRYEVRIGPA